MTRPGKNSSDRQCIVSRRNLNKISMIRFVAGPDGIIVPDLACKLPGRGFWIESCEKAVKTAIEQNLFSRVSKKTLNVTPDILRLLETTLTTRALGWLGFARRAGFLALGHDKVHSALKLGRTCLLYTSPSPRDLSTSRMPSSA